MSYYVKAVLIIGAAAVISFFVAELVIPERDAVTAKGSAAVEEPQAQADGDSLDDEDIPTVLVDPAAASKPAAAVDAKTAKAEPFDPRAAKTADTKTSAPPPSVPVVQPAAPPPPPKKPGAAPYRLEKVVVCASIKDREPQGVSNKFSKDTPYIYCFTHVVGARDSTAIVHRWYQNGKWIQTSPLPVKSNYWRTHSKRNLLTNPGDVTGQWRVDVIEPGANTVMESVSFTIE
jgi:hypothetical protein